MRGWGLIIRSFFVQASWNYSGLQNLGYFFMTWPTLARRGLPAPELVRAGQLHLKNFNTHPYFAGLVAATVIRAEESGASDESVEDLKHSLMCALGAVGDEFFWAALRPLAAVVALPSALAGAVWAPAIMLAIYNVPHLGVRIWGVRAGFGAGRGVVEMLQRQPLSRALPALGTATAILCGFLVGATALGRSWGLLPDQGPVSAGVAVLVFMVLLATQVRGLGQVRLLAGMSVLAVLAGIARVAGAP